MSMSPTGSVPPAAPQPIKPAISDINKPFWEGCRAGKLLAQQCTHCQERRYPAAEHPRRLLRLPVGGDRGHRVPLRAGAVRAAVAAADRDHLMAPVYQARHEVRADMPGRPDDNDAAHLYPTLQRTGPARPIFPQGWDDQSQPLSFGIIGRSAGGDLVAVIRRVAANSSLREI